MKVTPEGPKRSATLSVPGVCKLFRGGVLELVSVARVVAARDPEEQWERTMGRYALLWLLGVPIPILLLIYLFGGLH